jgi:hypothetical protein
MSGNRPFDQHTFILTTPDAVMTFPGLHIRSVAVLMHQQAPHNPTLYVKHSGETDILACDYTHQLEGIEDGRHFHKATITQRHGLRPTADIHWIDPDRHDIKIVPAVKMDAPEGLFSAVCSCGTYRSAPMIESSARLAGNQHAVTKTQRERNAV